MAAPTTKAAPKKRSSTSSAAAANKVAFPTSKATSSTATKKKAAVASTGQADSPEFDDQGFPSLFKAAQKRMGPPVHGDELTPIDIILKAWDCSEEYGPVSNLSRLERYERAQRLGLDPPAALGELLRTAPERYQNSSFNV